MTAKAQVAYHTGLHPRAPSRWTAARSMREASHCDGESKSVKERLKKENRRCRRDEDVETGSDSSMMAVGWSGGWR